jgi:V8-like Glu-specific endopeptidase
MRHDFALLELEGEIIRDEYLELPQDIESFPQPRLAVSGYVQDPHTVEYRHWTHFQNLAQINLGAILYNIDTEGGQSGSPAYLLYDGKVILIGIHKGHSTE